ncbi:MAG: isopropylmalate isomerase [Pseudomonadota bacterium]
MTDEPKSPDESSKKSTTSKAAIGAAATIGSAAIAAALLYAGKRFSKKPDAGSDDGKPENKIPSGEPPETD